MANAGKQKNQRVHYYGAIVNGAPKGVDPEFLGKRLGVDGIALVEEVVDDKITGAFRLFVEFQAQTKQTDLESGLRSAGYQFDRETIYSAEHGKRYGGPISNILSVPGNFKAYGTFSGKDDLFLRVKNNMLETQKEALKEKLNDNRDGQQRLFTKTAEQEAKLVAMQLALDTANEKNKEQADAMVLDVTEAADARIRE
eukprot:3736802-Rhodomonas_salina.1